MCAYRADCGQATQTTPILVQVISNFIGSTSVSASVLMAAASWNLCLDDPTRRSLGEADLCWYCPQRPNNLCNACPVCMCSQEKCSCSEMQLQQLNPNCILFNKDVAM